MSLLEEFLCWEDNWAIVPASVAYRVREKTGDIVIRRMESGPGDRINYYLLGKLSRQRVTGEFLAA